MKITQKEIESVSKLEPFKRYKYFMKRIADFEAMYSLKKDNEWALAEVDEHKLISLWSAKEFAEMNATAAWSGYKVVEISLENFEQSLIPFIKKKNYLINVFSVSGKVGFVVELDEFLRDLGEELKNYE